MVCLRMSLSANLVVHLDNIMSGTTVAGFDGSSYKQQNKQEVEIVIICNIVQYEIVMKIATCTACCVLSARMCGIKIRFKKQNDQSTIGARTYLYCMRDIIVPGQFW